MQVGDLYRYKDISTSGSNLRLVTDFDVSRCSMREPGGSPNGGRRDWYKPTNMTVEDCAWLEKKGHKVKLRTLDSEEMKKLCKESGHKVANSTQWKCIVRTLSGETFVPMFSIGYKNRGRVGSHDTACGYVIPACCLTLAVGELVIKKSAAWQQATKKHLDTYELLHGEKKTVPIVYDTTPQDLPIPDGWDNVAAGYCLGDWLIRRKSNGYGIDHPILTVKASKNHFSTPQLAATFVEEHLL